MNIKYYNWPGVTILVADDDPYLHLYLDKLLTKNGAKVIHANDGQEAIQKLSQNKIDLAIIDIVMPHIDGYEVAENIKSFYPETICVAYTADVLRANSEKCKNAGFSLCLLKPMLPTTLLTEIHKLLIKQKDIIQI